MQIIHAVIKANSRKGPLVEVHDNSVTLYVPQPAIDGKANSAAIALLAKHLQVPRSAVVLKKGQKSVHKTFIINLDKDKK
jgi:uncharacterized protein (TIGR00251 family)